MALAVKPVAVAAPQGVTNNRVTTSPRAGASAALSGPVEAANPVGGSSLGEGAFSTVVSQDESDFSGGSFSPGQRRDHHDDLPNPKTGIIEFTSQAFAQLLEMRDTISAGSSQSEGRDHGKASGRGIEYASALYESVIEIAAGNVNHRGETVSISL